MAFRIGSIAYLDAFKGARDSRDARPKTKGTFQEVINEFLASSEFNKLGERTKLDHRRNIMHEKGIEIEFGTAPIGAFDEKRIRKEVLSWRDSFSAGTGDNMMSTMQRLVSFGYERGMIGEHHLLKIKKTVKSNRAHVIWTREEIDLFEKFAPEYVSRILIVAVETGYRPGDMRLLDRSHFEERAGTDGRIVMRTQKSRGRNYATVPVTPRLAKLVKSLPESQTRIIVGANGKPLKHSAKLGQIVTEWRKKLEIREELRLYDARGTAVTRLVRAGCTLSELAAHMGWSFQHAAHMLERYAALDPEMTDSILEKVSRSQLLPGNKNKA